MRWPMARNLVSTPTSSTASVQAAGTEVRLLPISRLEAFSDAVFAIAITLLVLELHVPARNAALVKGLEHEWPRYLGYAAGFAFIGGVWIAHNYMTRFVKATDRGLIRRAGRTPGLATDDTARVELRGFARERKTAALPEASAAVVGLLLPVIAVIFCLAVSMIYLIEPFREVDIHAPRAARPRKPLILVCGLG